MRAKRALGQIGQAPLPHAERPFTGSFLPVFHPGHRRWIRPWGEEWEARWMQGEAAGRGEGTQTLMGSCGIQQGQDQTPSKTWGEGSLRGLIQAVSCSPGTGALPITSPFPRCPKGELGILLTW